LLLIRGQPGCGKSTLLKFALTKQLEAAAAADSLVMAFFFCASGTRLQNGIEGLFRSLLLQLFRQDVSSRLTFHEICRRHWTAEGKKKNNKLQWHLKELEASFERLVLECSARRKTVIFVDAIDECRDRDRDRLIRFFHSLKGRAQIRLNRPRVCFTCRLYPDGQIGADYQIRLEERNQQDIQSFIEQELRLPDETVSGLNELKQMLQEKAHGLFLWLVLVIQQVHDMSGKGLSLTTIQSEILKCPRELNGLYEDLLRKIEDNELLEASKLFQWMCFARRPLWLSELRSAMTVHLSGTKSTLREYETENNPNCIANERKMQKKMIYLSRGLADITNPNSGEGKARVGFFHESVNEFMRAKGLRYLNRRLTESGSLDKIGHFQLANACLNYLSTKEIRIAFSEKRLSIPTRFSFLEYSATYWLDHALEAEKAGFGENVQWPSQRTIDTWVQIRKFSEKYSPRCPEEGTSLMHIAAEHGLERLAKSICIQNKLEATAEIEQKNSLYDTMNKCSRPVKNMLNDNTKRNIVSMPNTSAMNQQRAKRAYGTKHISAMFVKDSIGGSVPETTCCDPRVLGVAEKSLNTALNAASASEQTDMKNARNNAGESPLYVAAKCGQLGMVRFLLGLDGELTIKNRNHCTVSYPASLNASDPELRSRYESGTNVDIHISTNEGHTPLHSALRNGHLEVVKLLYEHGADVDIHTATNDGWTPIHAASGSGHLEVVEFLYDHGADADIHSANNDGWTPLYLALRNSYLEVVEFLYKHRADVDIYTVMKYDFTPLNGASEGSHLEVVKFLYKHGADADIHTAINDGCTPINAASHNGHLEVVKFLYKHRADADIHKATNNSWTPINTASRNRHLEVVKFLYMHRADTDIHTTTNNGQTPIHAALGSGNLEVVKFLYNHRADTDIHIAINNS
jgi:ankyrin repeat protein